MPVARGLNPDAQGVMGKEITYCNQCGTRLLESDFNKGRAVTILSKDYCKACKGQAIKRGKSEGVTPESEKAPAPMKDLSTDNSAKLDKSAKSRTGPIKIVDTRRIPRATKSGLLQIDPSTKMWLLIGGIVMLVAIILLMVVLLKNGPPG